MCRPRLWKNTRPKKKKTDPIMAAVARKRRLPFFMSESSMQQIWAPWRMDYIKGLKEEDQKGCIFCWKPLADPAEDEKNLIVERREHCFLIMNL